MGAEDASQRDLHPTPGRPPSPRTRRAPFRPRAFETIIAQLSAAIASGALPNGSRLAAEREIARQLGVSRVTVRLALSVLADMGLVERKLGRNGGTLVTGDASQALSRSLELLLAMRGLGPRHLIEARLAIELVTAPLAATHHVPSDLVQLQRSLDGMSASEANPPAFASHGTRFHVGIAEASHNPILAHTMHALSQPLETWVAATCVVPGLAGGTDALHRPIFDAIAARQPAAARQAMLAHFRPLARYVGCLGEFWTEPDAPGPGDAV